MIIKTDLVNNLIHRFTKFQTRTVKSGQNLTMYLEICTVYYFHLHKDFQGNRLQQMESWSGLSLMGSGGGAQNVKIIL